MESHDNLEYLEAAVMSVAPARIRLTEALDAVPDDLRIVPVLFTLDGQLVDVYFQDVRLTSKVNRDELEINLKAAITVSRPSEEDVQAFRAAYEEGETDINVGFDVHLNGRSLVRQMREYGRYVLRDIKESP